MRLLSLLVFVLAADALRPVVRNGRAARVTRQAAAATDAAMCETYHQLAARCAERAAKLPDNGTLWIAIAGGPGAGKSTVAEAVAPLCAALGVEAAVLPMDGFHFSRARLCELDPPDAASYMPRRGAPHTFDAEAFYAALLDAKASGAAQLPTYSRELSDPVPGGAVLAPRHRVVLVEGNYLLLGALVASADAKIAREARRWAPLLALFDERWFVAPGGGVPAQRTRLVERHLKTWSEAKTAAWGVASPREGAEKRADFNDIPNAYLIDQTRSIADLFVESI